MFLRGKILNQHALKKILVFSKIFGIFVNVLKESELKHIYIDNSIMTRIFPSESYDGDLDFFIEFNEKCIKENKKLEMTPNSLCEFYGISQKSFDSEFNISKEETDKIISQTLKSTKKEDFFYENLYNAFTEFFQDKVKEEKLRSFILKKIEMKEKYAKFSCPQSQEAFKSLQDTYANGLIVRCPNFSTWFPMDRALRCNILHFLTSDKPLDRGRLAMCLLIECFRFISANKCPPFFQSLGIILKLSQSCQKVKNEKDIKQWFDICVGLWNSVKMDLKADQMDSELIVMSIFGSLTSEKPVHCFTCDPFNDLKTRLELIKSMCNGIAFGSEKKHMEEKIGFKVPDPKFGIVDCLSYNKDKKELSVQSLKVREVHPSS